MDVPDIEGGKARVSFHGTEYHCGLFFQSRLVQTQRLQLAVLS